MIPMSARITTACFDRPIPGKLIALMMEHVRLCCLAHGELACFFLEPDTGLDHCPRILLSCFRERTSGGRRQNLLKVKISGDLACNFMHAAGQTDRQTSQVPKKARGAEAEPIFIQGQPRAVPYYRFSF